MIMRLTTYVSQLGSIVANTHTTMQTRKEIDLQLHSRVHLGQNQKCKVRGTIINVVNFIIQLWQFGNLFYKYGHERGFDRH